MTTQTRPPSIAMGASAVDLFVKLVQSIESILSVTLIQYEQTASLARRTTSGLEFFEVELSNSRDERSRSIWIPDYEILYADSLTRGVVPHEMLREAAQHKVSPENRVRRSLPRDAVSSASFAKVRQAAPEWAVAVSSRVETCDGERHLPMIDFQCPIGPLYQASLVEGLRAIGCRGALLESGVSYHFYANHVVTDAGWRVFMGRTLLLAPFVDTRYVGHRLIDSESVLRVAADLTKPVEPHVVAIV
jgi:hypothetical protein